MQIRSQQDLASGVMYTLVGTGFAAGALTYDIGSAGRMGPGYFPLGLGTILALLGILLAVTAFHPSTQSDHLEKWDLRSLSLILIPVVLFGLLLPSLGLPISVLVLVIVSSLASDEFNWMVAAVSAVILAAVSVVLFVYGLGLPFQVWPSLLAD